MKRLKALIYRLGYPIAKVYWFLRRPVTEGVRCLVVYEDKVLLIRHTYGSSLRTTVGGGVNRGESLLEAVFREVKEEVGIILNNATHIGLVFCQAEFKKDTIQVFIARSETNILHCADGEIAEALWWQQDNLPEDVSPLFKKFWQLAEPHLQKLS